MIRHIPLLSIFLFLSFFSYSHAYDIEKVAGYEYFTETYWGGGGYSTYMEEDLVFGNTSVPLYLYYWVENPDSNNCRNIVFYEQESGWPSTAMFYLSATIVGEHTCRTTRNENYSISPTQAYKFAPNFTGETVGIMGSDPRINYLFTDDDFVPEPPVSDQTTRIVSTEPSNGSVISTSTPVTIGAQIFLNEADFDDGDYYVTIEYSHNEPPLSNPIVGINSCALGVGPFCFWNPANRSYDPVWTEAFDILTSGASSYSTSTDNISEEGRHYVVTSIRRNTLFLPDTVIVSTSTSFTFGTSTYYDLYTDYTNELLGPNGIFEESLDCTFDLSSSIGFNIFSDLSTCITSIAYRIVVPDSTSLTFLLSSLRDGILVKAPFGYATRLYDIFQASTTPATLPSTATVIPSYLPGAGTSIDFDVFTQIPIAIETIEAQSVPTMTGNPMTNFLYWWEILWKIVFIMWVIKQFYGAFSGGDFDHIRPGPGGRFRNDVQRRRRSMAVGRQAVREGADYSDSNSKY